MNLLKILVSISLLSIVQQSNAQWQLSGNAINSSRWLGSTNNYPLILKANQTEGLRLMPPLLGNTPFIGIGTLTPKHKLHIENGAVMISGSNSGGGPMILFSDNVNANSYPNGRWGIEYEPNAHGLNFWNPHNPSTGGGANFIMFLKDDGKVGIHTNNPTADFTVNGNMLIGDPNYVPIPNSNYNLFVQNGILTEKVKVSAIGTNWADYVFEENYELRTLNEVEAFIAEHKHLSNIPSAQEVKFNGIDLGEMNSKLLEKIEEITLYLIDLNKRIEILEKEISND